ncbi:YihY/virulence factor BrkB family protein [Methylosinus sp. Sm6]|uniref:YihY/virulence factor BrkB family protein n=1 Tax=Methylosinus sp. Sm6 TaxID=2866948 RepID=UPI00351CBF56
MRIPLDAFLHFSEGDGFAIASHIALSTLMSLFPFLIVVTALAAMVGSTRLADEAGRLLLDVWPPQVAAPIAGEIRRVATTPQRGALTIGALFAVYFASSGIESLRIGLNRAYEAQEERPWWLLRLESIVYVLGSAVALLILSVLVVLWPVATEIAAHYLGWFPPFWTFVTLARFAIATFVLGATLFAIHNWLPAGRRRLSETVPGVVVTLALWLVAGAAFGSYLSAFADRYVVTYAGLASAMVALVFLYFSAVIFIYGGELNAAIARARRGAR